MCLRASSPPLATARSGGRVGRGAGRTIEPTAGEALHGCHVGDRPAAGLVGCAVDGFRFDVDTGEVGLEVWRDLLVAGDLLADELLTVVEQGQPVGHVDIAVEPGGPAAL